jgi:hypothetical protein
MRFVGCRTSYTPCWWNWCNSIRAKHALNAQGLSWGPGNAKIERLKGTLLFSRIKSLQLLAHPRAVVDEGLDLLHVLANGLELSL